MNCSFFKTAKQFPSNVESHDENSTFAVFGNKVSAFEITFMII
jgi:hypothetical protein